MNKQANTWDELEQVGYVTPLTPEQVQEAKAKLNPPMDKTSMTYRAAEYYSKYIGQRGTEKQVTKILKTISFAIVRMARERGFES